MGGLTGRCRCGRVAWHATGSPFRAVFCHCESCRRAEGGPPAGYVGFAKVAVAWQGARAFRPTSPGVTRGACPDCATALSYMCTIWPGELYVHAATLDDPARFVPEAHLHWNARDDCARAGRVAPGDDLPKHAGRGPADLPRLSGQAS